MGRRLRLTDTSSAQKLTNSGGSTYFVYGPTAGVPAVLVETDGENETFYVREPGGELIARATGQTRQYYLFDRLGSTIAMVPAVEGNPTDRLFYTPWGELVTSGSRASTVGTSANPYRYVGEFGYYYHHQDAGLQDWMQLGVRFYQPELGRFERRDPLFATATWTFAYCRGRPTLARDPTGRYAQSSGPGDQPIDPDYLCDIYSCAHDMVEAADSEARATGVGGMHNGSGDALRHCIGMCKMVAHCPAGTAEIAGYGHELAPLLRPDLWDEVSMDLNNNKEGRACGASVTRFPAVYTVPGKPPQWNGSCLDCCMKKRSDGDLDVLK